MRRCCDRFDVHDDGDVGDDTVILLLMMMTTMMAMM